MRYFTLIETNINNEENLEEETIEKDLVCLWGLTATEVVATVEEYLNGKGFRFYRTDKMSWSDGFNINITLVGC